MPDRLADLQHRRTPAGDHTIFARCSPAWPKGNGGAPLVLVHGLVISSVYMVPTAQRLAAHLPVAAPDMPGFGYSSRPRRTLDVSQLADALVAWLDACGVDSAVWLGNSFGCQVIVDLAARHPTRVRAAVLVGPTMDALARRVLPHVARLLMDVPRERLSLAYYQAMNALIAGPWRSWQTFRYALADELEHKLPRVTAPTLVVRGERDPIVPQRWAQTVADLLPQGDFSVIPGAPHAANYSAPDALVEATAPFILRHARREPA